MKLLRIVGAFISRDLRIAVSYRASIFLEFLGVHVHFQPVFLRIDAKG